jgi:hypothetical protein
MTPLAHRVRLDRHSHLMEIARLEVLVPAKLVNMREKKGRVADMSSTELYLMVNYFASYFPVVMVGVALAITTCSINAVGTRRTG